jgi:hypothetical protein
MIMQEGVPFLSILYFLLAYVAICSDAIQEWIVDIGLVPLGLSLSIGEVSKEIGIHFAAQLFAFTGDLFPVRMQFVRSLPDRLAAFNLCGNIVDLCATLH